MPKFTAIIYACAEDAPYLNRALESLKCASDIMLINADNDPEVSSAARKRFVRQRRGIPGVSPGAYTMDAFHDWILVMRPHEALSKDLQRSLDEWRKKKHDESHGYAFGIWQQDGEKWQSLPAEMRLVNRRQVNWMGELPPRMNAPALPGPLLRYEHGQENQKAA
ncbi:MAG TPA: hypothetical protein VF135_00320 [Terriglobales bacterium]